MNDWNNLTREEREHILIRRMIYIISLLTIFLSPLSLLNEPATKLFLFLFLSGVGAIGNIIGMIYLACEFERNMVIFVPLLGILFSIWGLLNL